MTAGDVSDRHEIGRLVDELEQVRTALETVQEQLASIAQERDYLRTALDRMGRDLGAADKARRKAESDAAALAGKSAVESMRNSQTEEELRAAFEELQVMTEELEVTNATLREANQHLDERVAARTAEIGKANKRLAKSETRFRTLVEGMPQLVWRSESGGDWTWCSPQWIGFSGLSLTRSLGQGWLDAIHPEDRPAVVEAWRTADGRNAFQVDARIHSVQDGRFRHFRTRAMPVHDADGTILEWLGTSTDVNDITELRERQGVLLAELQHRTRNLMGVVRSLVSRTLRGSSSLEDFTRRLEPRLAALSRVQGVLSRRREGERITVNALIREELAAHIDLESQDFADRVQLEGPDVRLKSSTVQIFALGLHELTTNALKYGALSPRGGNLTVRWEVRPSDEGPRLNVVWVEEGVAGLEASGTSPREGYGRELIERALPYQLGARTTYELGPEGVRCEIDAPLDERS